MTKDQQMLIQAARNSLQAARLLFDGGHWGFAASRAYYVMFYVAQAMLLGQGLSFSRHSAVASSFGRLFAKTGDVPVEMHRYLLEGQEMWHQGDYQPQNTLRAEEAQEALRRAQLFVEMGERFMGPPSP